MRASFALTLLLAMLSVGCAGERVRLECEAGVVIVATREGPGERVRVVTETEPSIDQYGVLQPFEGWDFLSPVPLPMETVRVEIARDGTVTAVDGEGERSTVGFIEGWRLPGRQDRGRDIVAVVHGDPVFRKGATIPFDPAKAK